MQPIIRLDLRPKQRLFLTPAFKQALKILTLPLWELKELIEEEVNTNPILEKIEKTYRSQVKAKEFFHLEKNLSQPVSFYGHLQKQAQIIFSKQDLSIASFLIGSLNEKGFLDEKIEEIAEKFKTSSTKILEILKKIQTFDPVGIGARNLQESWLIQLQDQNKEKTLAYQIVKNEVFFSLFLKKQHQKLSSLLQISKEQLNNTIQDLKYLKLDPAAEFSSATLPTACIPDLTIHYENGYFFVYLNKEHLPALKINRRYLNLLANDPKHLLKAEEKKFLKKCFFSARSFLKTLQRRDLLLKQLAYLLIKLQKGYLLGINPLRPFSLKQLAQDLNLSLSSAYRLISHKYLLSLRGLEPLKGLFSLPVKNSNISQKNAIDLLKKMIDEENKRKPLSDVALAKKLLALGISWKRRTVSKYRQRLKIAPAHLRKIS